MKKKLLAFSVLIIVLAVTALLIKNPAANKPVTTVYVATSFSSTATQTDALSTQALSTSEPVETSTTKIWTTQALAAQTTINPQIVTGAPDANAKTYTGYRPLAPLKLTVLDPDNTRGLSTTKIGYSFGVAKNAKPHNKSLENQQYFDQKNFDALALDTKATKKVLYLTFDCGYENGYTGKILDTLKAKNVPAAFFCTLPFIKQQPELTTRMIKEGHIVGNHSDTHPEFPDISRTEMAKEVLSCDNYLREHFGYSAPYFRFPGGSYSDSSLDLVQSLGFRSVFWSVAYADWDPAKQKGTQYAFDTVTSRLHPGAVILLHAVSKDNTAALGDIIDWARAQGYAFKAL